LETGRTVYADISEITLNTSYTVNSKHPYVITASGKIPTQDCFTFLPATISGLIPNYNTRKGITSLPVYIDPENQKITLSQSRI